MHDRVPNLRVPYVFVRLWKLTPAQGSTPRLPSWHAFRVL
jgi:hypothetical protein